MARKARERYVVKHPKYHLNGKSMLGVEVILIGECSHSGAMKTPDGKKLYKNDITCYLLRFADKKQYRHFGVPPKDFVFTQKSFDTYFEPA